MTVAWRVASLVWGVWQRVASSTCEWRSITPWVDEGVAHDYVTRGVDMGVKLNQLDPGGAAVDCNILQVLEGLGGFWGG